MNSYNLPEPDVVGMVTELRGAYDTHVNPLLREWTTRCESIVSAVTGLDLEGDATLEDYPPETYRALVSELTTPSPAITWDTSVPQLPGMVNRLTESLRNVTCRNMHRGYFASKDKTEAWQKLLKASEDCVTDQIYAEKVRQPLERTLMLSKKSGMTIESSNMSQTDKERALRYIEESANKPYNDAMKYLNRIKKFNELKFEAACQNLSEKDPVFDYVCNHLSIPEPSEILSMRTYPTRFAVSHITEKHEQTFEDEIYSELESLEQGIAPNPDLGAMAIETITQDQEQQKQLQSLINEKRAESRMMDNLNDWAANLCATYRMKDNTPFSSPLQISAEEMEFYEGSSSLSSVNINRKRGYDDEDATEGGSKKQMTGW